MLASFTVSSLRDAGPGSLRDAVARSEASPGADTIRFAPALAGTIVLTTGQLEVTGDVTIDGPGSASLAISGGGASRIFSLTGASARLALDDVTLTGGRATTVDAVGPGLVRGGAIRNDGGRLQLARVVFLGNRAESDPAGPSAAGIVGGGAVVNSAGATLDAIDCTFRGNRVSGGTRYAFGGAIANVTDSSATLVRCTFTGNSAADGAADHGGAVGNFGASTLVVRGCSFVGNEARGSGSAPASGGAIATRPGTVSTSGSRTTIEASRFAGNSAIGGRDGGDATGGALANADSILTATQCEFSGNLASAGRGAVAAGGAVGVGSVFGGVAPSTRLVRSTLLSNRAQAGMGGIAFGGACSNEEGSMEIELATLSGNVASTPYTTLPGAASGAAYGGAIAVGLPAGGRGEQPAMLSLRLSTVSGNSAIAGSAQGGGVFAGALVPGPLPTVRIVASRFARNVPDGIAGNVG